MYVRLADCLLTSHEDLTLIPDLISYAYGICLRSVAEDYWRPEAEALLRKHGVEY